jgi:predicted CoA-substrate-specific enzyme activase
MVVAGIDVGGKNVHIVIMDDGKVLAKGMGPTGIKKAEATANLYDSLLRQANLTRDKVHTVVATGSSGSRAAFANGFIPDAAADARAVAKMYPTVRTVIDVGAEEGRAIKVGPDGNVKDFAINEKCAAGTGTFVEAMSRALEVTVEDMSTISLESAQAPSMNAQCAVFGESEVVSLIHQKIEKRDIARAVHDAIAGRVGSVARIIGIEKDVAMVGGMALNAGFVDSLRRDIGMDVIVPAEADYAGAYGAAYAAAAGVTAAEKVKAKVLETQEPAKG